MWQEFYDCSSNCPVLLTPRFLAFAANHRLASCSLVQTMGQVRGALSLHLGFLGLYNWSKIGRLACFWPCRSSGNWRNWTSQSQTLQLVLHCTALRSLSIAPNLQGLRKFVSVCFFFWTSLPYRTFLLSIRAGKLGRVLMECESVAGRARGNSSIRRTWTLHFFRGERVELILLL